LEEVESALKKMPLGRSSGQDGLTTIFLGRCYVDEDRRTQTQTEYTKHTIY